MLAGMTGLFAAQQPVEPEPARFTSGPLPPLPALALGAGEVLLELDVTEGGRVTSATVLRATPPFTDMLVEATRQWRFEPARRLVPPDAPDGRPTLEAAPARVLVVGMFRAPAMLAPTLGQPPRDIGQPTAAIPFPMALRLPPWPPRAHAGGVVLVGARVDAGGTVREAEVLQGSPGFDDAALDAVRGWSFRPARDPDVAPTAYVYAVLGFQVPLIP
jgi:periplasmic protein TonB